MGFYGFLMGFYGFFMGCLRVAPKPGYHNLWVFYGKIMGFYGMIMGFYGKIMGFGTKTLFFESNPRKNTYPTENRYRERTWDNRKF